MSSGSVSVISSMPGDSGSSSGMTTGVSGMTTGVSGFSEGVSGFSVGASGFSGFGFFTPIEANQRLKRLEAKKRKAAIRMTRKSPVTMRPKRFSDQSTAAAPQRPPRPPPNRRLSPARLPMKASTSEERKAPKSAMRVVLISEYGQRCASRRTETAVRMISRAKLPRPKRFATSRCPVLKPSLPATLPTARPACMAFGSPSRLMSSRQWKR